MKLLAVRVVAFAVLMALYAVNPWIGIAVLVCATCYAIGQSRQRSAASVGSSSAAATLAVFACAGVALTAQSGSLSIRGQIRETGGFERIVLAGDEPLQLSDLVSGADLIVEGSSAGGRSFLNPAETDIHTDYPFTLHAVLKSPTRLNLRVGDQVTVRRDSGALMVEGRPATSDESDFPLFKHGEHYVLFLVESADRDVFRVYGASQGAFTVAPSVSQLSNEVGTWNRTHGPVSLASFFDEVRALLNAGERPPV